MESVMELDYVIVRKGADGDEGMYYRTDTDDGYSYITLFSNGYTIVFQPGEMNIVLDHPYSLCRVDKTLDGRIEDSIRPLKRPFHIHKGKPERDALYYLGGLYYVDNRTMIYIGGDYFVSALFGEKPIIDKESNTTPDVVNEGDLLLKFFSTSSHDQKWSGIKNIDK